MWHPCGCTTGKTEVTKFDKHGPIELECTSCGATYRRKTPIDATTAVELGITTDDELHPMWHGLWSTQAEDSAPDDTAEDLDPREGEPREDYVDRVYAMQHGEPMLMATV